MTIDLIDGIDCEVDHSIQITVYRSQYTDETHVTKIKTGALIFYKNILRNIADVINCINYAINYVEIMQLKKNKLMKAKVWFK